MKRKWIWLLAIVPLISGLVFAQELIEKRPIVIARGLDVSGVTISPDGKRIVARGDWKKQSQIIELASGSQVAISGNINTQFFFSPDAMKIYQLNSELVNPQELSQKVLQVRDANSGRLAGQFRFSRDLHLYGVAWRDGEVVAESARQTWHFNPRTLQVIRTQKQHRARVSAELCPDGKTFYWRSGGDEMGTTPYTWSFADLRTEKILWTEGPSFDTGSPLGFSVDGRTVLWSNFGANEKGVIARDTRTGAEKWRLNGPERDGLALAPDQSAIYEARHKGQNVYDPTRLNDEIWKWPR